MRISLIFAILSSLLLSSCGVSLLPKDVNRLIYRAEVKNCKSDIRAKRVELRTHVKSSYQIRKSISPVLDSIHAHAIGDTLLMREVYVGNCMNCPFSELDIFTSNYVVRILHHPLRNNPIQIDTVQLADLDDDLMEADEVLQLLLTSMKSGVKWWERPARISLGECPTSNSDFNFFIITTERKSYSYLRDCTGHFP